MASIPTFRPLRLAAVLFAAGGVVLALLPWWRNRTLLLDFFDYGLVMAAVGRIASGDRPYVDFSTPIQTLQFIVSAWSERLFGATYLGLTMGNGFFIGGSLVLFFALLRKRVGGWLGWTLAVAIVVGTSSQHTIIWYNAIGTLCLAVVVWNGADAGRRGAAGWGNEVAIWAALWLGGMNKLTYQAAALAFAVTLAWQAANEQRTSWTTAWRRIFAYGVFGLIAPVASELCYTKASLADWLQNVVVTPARFRTDMLQQIGELPFYFKTPHDYYKPLYFSAIGAAGTILIVLITALLAGELLAAEGERRWRRLALLGLLAGGAWICGVVLLATNMDIAYLSATAWLVFATGLIVAFPMADGGRKRCARALLAAAAIGLTVPAWISAWAGARALWGHQKLVRERLVSTDDLPPEFGYLRGMRVLPSFHGSVLDFSQRRAELAATGVRDDEYYFTSATEWLVRALPESRHRGRPLWFAGGTTLSDDDAWALGEEVAHDPHSTVIVGYGGWDFWYAAFRKMLAEDYRDRRGEWLRLFVRRTPPDPVTFAVNTHSNLNVGAIRVHSGAAELAAAKNGLFYYGGSKPHRLDCGFGLYRLAGEMVGELPAAAAGPARARFRIMARDGARLTDTLWDETVELSADARTITRPFAISPGGRPVSLMVNFASGGRATFGWRALKTEQAGGNESTPPWPMDWRLPPSPMQAQLRGKLLADGKNIERDLRVFGDVKQSAVADGTIVQAAPGEIWFRPPVGQGHLSGDFVAHTTPGLPEAESGLRVCVIAYRAGRFDLMMQRDFPADTKTGEHAGHFEAWLPEGEGWFGLVALRLGHSAEPVGAVDWRQLRTQ